MDIARLESIQAQILRYENLNFKEKVQNTIPVKSLYEEAVQKGSSGGLTFHEHFIKEVMRWFKAEFFIWVDTKVCDVCGSPSQSGPPLTPTTEELAAGGTRVENHVCTVCGRSQRFPRYNCPIKLLETREGRCGEWANCFTGICRALGYDTRFIYDVTDHVWTEIYSPHLNRWVHLDSCENAWDRPLIYEQGWKENLSYVVAFSKDEIVDVTYRYTISPTEVRSRRENESAVMSAISAYNKLKFHHSPQKKALLTRRLAHEITSWLVKPQNPDAGVYGGRESGSLAWRQSRGEGGTVSHGHTIDAGEVAHSYKITYTPATDQYTVVKDGSSSETHQSFISLANECQGVIRKVEYDWNMTYLARDKNDTTSTIKWCIKTSRPIKSATVKMSHATFESGEISWSCHPAGSPPDFHSQFSDIDLSFLIGRSSFHIVAQMKGSNCHDNSWQHTQLFRTELDGYSSPFYVELLF